VTIVLLLPEKNYPSGAPSIPEGPAQIVSSAPAHLTAADRRAINSVLDRFLPAAMERKNPALAWKLAGPEMKAGSTLAEWRRNDSPVPYYPAREQTFHDWQTIDVGQRYVIFNLLLHPGPGSKLATYNFSGEVVKIGDRWLVNRLYTIAIDNPITKTTHEIGPADFLPQNAAPAGGKSPLGGLGILPAIAILSLILLLPLGFVVLSVVRGRRFRRETAKRGSSSLPPLPSAYRKTPETGEEPSASA
jgi:hypothetical protein